MRSSDLISNRVPFTAKFPGGEVKGFFNPQVASRAFFEQYPFAVEALGNGYLVEWDLIGGDGEMVPLTPEAIGAEPGWVIQGVWEAIIETRRPN